MGTVAKSSITLTSISDAYAVALTPSTCVIHADFDGTNPKLENAYTLISVYCGEQKVPISIQNVSSTAGVDCKIGKVDDYSYKLSITSINPDVLQGFIDVTVNANDYTVLSARFVFSIERESTMLDWIQDWENNKTTIGSSYVITPKLFVGKKITGSYDKLEDVPGLTGVYIGPSENDGCGIYGYKDSIEIFHLDGTGGKIGGWSILEDGLYSANGRLKILTNGVVSSVDENGNAIWQIREDGDASFAKGNVKFNADGSAEFNGSITAESGLIAGWIISANQLRNAHIGIASKDAVIGVFESNMINNAQTNEPAILENVTYGGVALYYKSSTDYGLVAYPTGSLDSQKNKVISLGSTNYIAGWNFDDTALWLGDKNNNTAQYTSDISSITIGTNGLRGNSWFIDKDGTASFVKGLVTFGQTSGDIVGWTLSTNKIATNHIALTSVSGIAGLYMTSHANGNFIDRSPDAMAGFISGYGGIYLNTTEESADLAAYNSSAKLLFRVRSNGASSVAGWNFDDTTLYTGTAVTSGYTTSGNITLGPTGLRGYKWRFENDGSGALAGGNISWDENGDVTFADSVKINWSNLGSTIIDANGIFTGKISADNITAGTISTATIKNSTGTWRLNQDGSGMLGDGNISWLADGTLTVKNSNLNNVIISGSVRTPFVDGYTILGDSGPIAVSTYGIQNNNCVVIPGTGGGFYTSFSVPFTSKYNGFRVIILNYHWGGTKASGPISASAPKGYYFYENGEPLSELVINQYEMVEMIGIGEGDTFSGWLVLNRQLYNYNDVSGSPVGIGEGFTVKAMYAGKIDCSSGTPKLARQKRWDQNMYGHENKILYISYPINGDKYVTVHIPDGVFSSADKYDVILTGHNDVSASVYACVMNKTANSFTVYTGDDDSFNAGGFTFLILGTWFWK